ncbi:MAG: hypothetical protein CL816_05535 [Coxiellaceae bacterium]|nr:hypothetical protein [Coxiellaceae bacterium]
MKQILTALVSVALGVSVISTSTAGPSNSLRPPVAGEQNQLEGKHVVANLSESEPREDDSVSRKLRKIEKKQDRICRQTKVFECGLNG